MHNYVIPDIWIEEANKKKRILKGAKINRYDDVDGNFIENEWEQLNSLKNLFIFVELEIVCSISLTWNERITRHLADFINSIEIDYFFSVLFIEDETNENWQNK